MMGCYQSNFGFNSNYSLQKSRVRASTEQEYQRWRRSQKPRTESRNSDQVETLNLSQSDPLGLGYNHGFDNINFQFQGSHTAGGHPQPTQAMVGNQACTSSGSDAQSVLSHEVQLRHSLEPSSTGSNSFRPPFPRSTPTTLARPSATINFGASHHPDGFVPPRRVNYVSENSSDVHAVSNPIQGRLGETSSCEQPLIEVTNPLNLS